MNRNVAYFKMPKCGSTTIQICFENYENLFFYHNYEEFLSDIEIDKKNCLKFTTVRNPYQRAISSWQHCLKEKWIEKISLLDFLKFDYKLRNETILYSMPQTTYIKELLKNDINFVIKIENLIDEFKKFLPSVKITNNYNVNTKEKYNLSNIEKEKIEEIFKDDFIFLKYKSNED